MSLSWNCLGDSITDDIYIENHYYTYIMARCPGITMRNYGISGTRISGEDESAFCQRYRKMKKADVITVFGGVNDWGQQNPAPLGVFEDRDCRTFYGALHLLCQGLQSEYPEAVVIFFTPIGNVGFGQFAIGKNVLGYTVEDYADAICRVCAAYKIPVLDLCRECGFTPENPAQRERCFIDGLHLSDEGHWRISYPIEAMLKKYCGSDFAHRAPKGMTDLFLFMGQSNMAGRGITDDAHPEGAPALIPGAGYEYRAVTDPDTLHVMAEPFGRYENRKDGIDDGEKKTGSMAVAFTNMYYSQTGVPVTGISASKGGSSILEWQPGGAYLEDVKKRLAGGKACLNQKGYQIRHIYMLWCQGETDADERMSRQEYEMYFNRMYGEMKEAGVEKCFLVRIGRFNTMEDPERYDAMIRTQTQMAQEYEDVVLVSTVLAGMREKGLMKDAYHYYQAAYNRAGREAGRNAAYYVNTGLEPMMYDPAVGGLYFSRK